MKKETPNHKPNLLLRKRRISKFSGGGTRTHLPHTGERRAAGEERGGKKET